MIKKILNLGCGDDTYGTHFVDKYPTRSKVVKCDIDVDKLPYKRDFFDEILVSSVFEHITNLTNFFQECHRTLKIGGRLIIITSNAGFWGIFGKVHHGNYIGRGKEDDHYTLFTPIHLEKWLKKFGFTVVSSEYYIKKKTRKDMVFIL